MDASILGDVVDPILDAFPNLDPPGDVARETQPAIGQGITGGPTKKNESIIQGSFQVLVLYF